MIKNLVLGGCSFTAPLTSWGYALAKQYQIPNVYNIAASGAGNYFIAHSIIEFLIDQELNPAETLVLIMWSGTGRKDVRLSGEWFWYLDKKYSSKKQIKLANEQENSYFLFSGGLSNSWNTNDVTKKIFNEQYKINDPNIMCRESMMHFINTENFLKLNGYYYQFTAGMDIWNKDNPSHNITGDYQIGYYCKESIMYQKFDFAKWVFANDNTQGILEFACARQKIDKTLHPTIQGHIDFCNEIIVPVVTKYFYVHPTT